MDAPAFYEMAAPQDSIDALEEFLVDTAGMTQSTHVAVRKSRPMTVKQAAQKTENNVFSR